MIIYDKKDIPNHLQKYFTPAEFGLEPTFQEFINRLCGTFDGVKRVLKKEGTCWVNLGDTYMGNSSYSKKGRVGLGNDKVGMTNDMLVKATDEKKYGKTKGRLKCFGSKELKEKSLCQIPSRFAIEMCNRGWILRNEIVWHKKNAMSSSVTDRLTNKFEKVYLFTKSKKYYFDLDSIRIPFEVNEKRPSGFVRSRDKKYNSKYNIPETEEKNIEAAKQNERFGKRRHPQRNYTKNERGKNPGDVWTLTSQPYPDAHFATYPEKLLITPIKAGCPKKGIVLDPFFGSGTTGRVAKDLNRNFIGFELNPDYCKLADKRLCQQVLI